MKRTIIGLLAGLALLTTGCNENTYSNLRNQEDKLIANYIRRNNLNILTTEPEDNYQWGEKDYYKVSGYDNFYFHLISRGDSVRIDSVSPTRTDTVNLEIDVKKNPLIIVRYKQFDLTENPDTLDYWTTNTQVYPYEFHYGNTNECECTAWHIAVRLMKYPDSQCQILVPSKMGFNADQTTVTPYMYIMKIKVKQ